MGRTHSEMMAGLPEARRKAIEARAAELIAEVEGLQAFRKLAEQSQAEMAAKLKIKQPSVHKIEKQTDLYLSTLRRYVEAAGGRRHARTARAAAGQGDDEPDGGGGFDLRSASLTYEPMTHSSSA